MKHPDGHIGAIEEACNKLGTGIWSLAQFHRFVEELRQNIHAQSQLFQSMEAPEDQMEHLRDSLVHAFIGRDFWDRGADKLLEFAETTDVDVLEVALDLCQQGHDNVERALRTLRHKRKVMEQELRQIES